MRPSSDRAREGGRPRGMGALRYGVVLRSVGSLVPFAGGIVLGSALVAGTGCDRGTPRVPGTPAGAVGGTPGVGSTGGAGDTTTGGEQASGGAPDGGGATAGSAGSGGDGTAGTAPGGATGTGSVPVLPPTVTNLRVEPNPNSTISAYVSWTTAAAADSTVEFGSGEYEYRIYDEADVTDHRVLVIGMVAETDYEMRVVSANAGGTSSATTTFATGSLPDSIPLPTLTTSQSRSQPGWTLVNIQPETTATGEQPPGVAVMYDEQGRVVWYYVNGNLPDERGDVSVDFLPNGNVLIGPTTFEPPKEVDLGGNVVWIGPPQVTDPFGPSMSHDVKKLSSGNYVLLRNQYDASEFLGALIEEVTPDNDIVWSWSLFDHIQPDHEVDSQDWCHPNSVTIDETRDYVYLACRWLGVIKAHRYDDQSVVWTLGEGLAGSSFTFDPPDAGFADEHDPEFHDDGTVLIYDNGGFLIPSTGNEHSRVLEFSLDEASLAATLTWSFPGTFVVDAWYHDEWYTPFWGDADRLANGNVLVTAGMRSASASGRIFEVAREDGQVVWEVVFDPNVGCYQSERISPPPLVEAL